jgi:hypothetical protein
MILSTKTCQIKRNRRNPAKNSSNPSTPKTPKSSPLTHGFGHPVCSAGGMDGSPATAAVAMKRPRVGERRGEGSEVPERR